LWNIILDFTFRALRKQLTNAQTAVTDRVSARPSHRACYVGSRDGRQNCVGRCTLYFATLALNMSPSQQYEAVRSYCVNFLLIYWRALNYIMPIPVVVLSKAWIVFTRSNTGIMSSNPTQGMDVCLRLIGVCVDSDLATRWSPVEGVLSALLGLGNWSETKRFTDALCSRVGATGKRERLYHTASPMKHYRAISNLINSSWYMLKSSFITLCRGRFDINSYRWPRHSSSG
jgi:hypothetical protein